MKGKHKIIVQDKRVKYDFEIKRNITILRGDSATGKTVLIEMIAAHFRDGTSSGVTLVCDKQCAVIDGRLWKEELSALHDSIIFIDEGNRFIFSTDFSRIIQNTDNYYVIVTREGIPTLPYSVNEIYGIRVSGKYGGLSHVYNEFYQLYGIKNYNGYERPELLIVEDSNSGFQFFKGVCDNKCACISANGKSNVFAVAIDNLQKEILIIADSAAFGSEIEKLINLIVEHQNIRLYLPESFEWLILKSEILNNTKIAHMLEHPEDEIECKEYFSWERFFTEQLIYYTKDSYLKYSKSNLNPVYLQKKYKKKILNEIKWLKLLVDSNEKKEFAEMKLF